jgi:hypothetical protein
MAATISAAVEGSADAAELVVQCGGIEILVAMLKTGGGQGKKAAAEALQASRSLATIVLCLGPACCRKCMTTGWPRIL